jgi:taurine dioxygenase
MATSAPKRAPSRRDWPFDLRPLSPALGCKIMGLTVEQAARDDVFPAVYLAFLEHQAILFRDVDLPPETQVAFARRFGEVQVHVMNQYRGYEKFPEIYLLTNLDEDGRPNGKHPDRGTLYWHSDGSWRRRTGQATLMYAEQVPQSGGQTHFADMYGAYDSLSAATDAQRAEAPPVVHPIVRTHPETGRKAIFLGDHAEKIEAMDHAQGRALIDEVNDLATAAPLVYEHVWSPRQCLVWDNRCLMHRATIYDTAKERRVMRRCTILDDQPF